MSGSFCPECGQPLEPEAKFCGECGSETGQPAPDVTSPVAAPLEPSGQTAMAEQQELAPPTAPLPEGKGGSLRFLVMTVVLLLIVAAAGGFLWSRRDTTEAGAPDSSQTPNTANTGTTSSRSSGQYPEVKIGNQTWMAKNLDTGTFRNGDPIPEAKTAAEWDAAGDAKKPAWSYYDNDPANGKTYGRLYNWYAVSDRSGLCPQGWHVPTNAEWDILVNYLGGESVAGGKMKETGTAHWESPNTGATNSSGLSALPGGSRDASGGFYRLGDNAGFWSATEYGSGYAWGRSLGYDYSDVGRGSSGKEGGFSVRCVRD